MYAEIVDPIKAGILLLDLRAKNGGRNEQKIVICERAKAKRGIQEKSKTGLSRHFVPHNDEQLDCHNFRHFWGNLIYYNMSRPVAI